VPAGRPLRPGAGLPAQRAAFAASARLRLLKVPLEKSAHSTTSMTEEEEGTGPICGDVVGSGSVRRRSVTEEGKMEDPNRVIKLNVGGKVFTSTLSTLAGSEPDSVLAAMFRGDNGAARPARMDADGAYFIDRSPDAFAAIIEFLRTRR